MAQDATTFITEWSRYWYLRTPQGFHTSGDGYTRWFDDMTVDVPRKTHCIDNTLLWDETMESTFWHTLDYITHCGRNGIVFNPNKFHFADDEVEFAGFLIMVNGVKRQKKMTDAIFNFPTPTSITGVRFWLDWSTRSLMHSHRPKLWPYFKNYCVQRTENFGGMLH